MNHPCKPLLILADKTRILRVSFSSIFILKDHCTTHFGEMKARRTEAEDRSIYKISDDLSIQEVQWSFLAILRNGNPKNEIFLKKYLIIWFQKNTKNKAFFEK